MSDTCIVCLGDLNANAPLVPLPTLATGDRDPGEVDDEGGGTLPIKLEETPVPLVTIPSELIAHLLPCGHNLHDECLKPWVERANSCPICRQNFNEVELCKHLNGPIVSSYAVADRKQVAEIDPTMLIDDLDEQDFPPCMMCGEDDHDEVLMICDGCEKTAHTYCMALDAVPIGHWFCDQCVASRENAATEVRPNRRSRRAGVRTTAQFQEARHRDLTISSDWARVWQAVSDRAGFDLDFPHENGSVYSSFPHLRNNAVTSTRNTGSSWRSTWERRLQVAERQGASRRFREGASAFIDAPTRSRPRPAPPEPESLEEVLAWNAFEKARDIQTDPVPRSRKRKSTTASPSEADSSRPKKRRRSKTASPREPLAVPEPERRLKRPRTRRALDVNEPSSDNGEPSTSRRRSLVNGLQSPDATNANTPSFLQSLLKEVETSAVPDEPNTITIPPSNSASPDQPSPTFNSPVGSPTASNHPSPRAMSTTPPPVPARSNSPAPLTSKVEPVYPAAPDLNQTDASPTSKSQGLSNRPKSQTRVGRWALQTAHCSSPPRSEETSPTRMNMSLSAKESIQKLVKEALKEPYHHQQVNKDQYTDINRHVSRMLYDKVGEDGSLGINGDMAHRWRKMAFEEVAKALSTLSDTAAT